MCDGQCIEGSEKQMNVRDALLNKTIVAVAMSDNKKQMTFVTSTGPVVIYAEGDCCSSSWFESVDDPAALLGTVQEVEEIPMPDLGNQPDHEVMRYYGLKITTEKGRAVIDYRNDSNGYYGGYLTVREPR